jgi:hypothetical protein
MKAVLKCPAYKSTYKKLAVSIDNYSQKNERQKHLINYLQKQT